MFAILTQDRINLVPKGLNFNVSAIINVAKIDKMHKFAKINVSKHNFFIFFTLLENKKQ